MSEKKIISVSAILTDLENGLQRKDIRAKYTLTVKQMSYLFNHPSLKGKKAKKNVADELEIVDDTLIEEANSQIAETVSQPENTNEIWNDALPEQPEQEANPFI